MQLLCLPNLATVYNNMANGLNADMTTVGNNWDTSYANQQGQEDLQNTTANNNNSATRESQLGTLNQNTNSNYNTLMALLGGAGAGVSSAASNNVPYAVAQNASAGQSGIDNTYNTNASTIDTSYKSAMNDLLNQYNSGKSNALQSLSTQQAQDYLQAQAADTNATAYNGSNYGNATANAATAGQNAVNAEDAITQLMNQYQTPTFTPEAAPNLASFSYDPTTVNAASANPTTSTGFLPYLTQLQQPNLLTGANTTPAPAGG